MLRSSISSALVTQLVANRAASAVSRRRLARQGVERDCSTARPSSVRRRSRAVLSWCPVVHICSVGPVAREPSFGTVKRVEQRRHLPLGVYFLCRSLPPTSRHPVFRNRRLPRCWTLTAPGTSSLSRLGPLCKASWSSAAKLKHCSFRGVKLSDTKLTDIDADCLTAFRNERAQGAT